MRLYKNYPSLDLHGLDTQYAKILIQEFLIDQEKMGNKECIIIHGKGKGLLKKATMEVLRKNRLVENFKLDNYNVGCTIVKLK